MEPNVDHRTSRDPRGYTCSSHRQPPTGSHRLGAVAETPGRGTFDKAIREPSDHPGRDACCLAFPNPSSKAHPAKGPTAPDDSLREDFSSRLRNSAKREVRDFRGNRLGRQPQPR
ncbi:hypothetical protein GN956_G9110 [Arapaima gigas]